MSEKVGQLKMKSTNGKNFKTDVAEEQLCATADKPFNMNVFINDWK